MSVIEQLIILAPIIAFLDALITFYVHLKTIDFHNEQTKLINSVGDDIRSVRSFPNLSAPPQQNETQRDVKVKIKEDET